MKTVVPVYVINLDRSEERLARITAELEGAGLAFRRIQAVDAAELPHQVAEYDVMANARCYLAPLSRAEIACVLSHRRAWHLITRQTEQNAAVVLEDDASLATSVRDLSGLVETVARSSRPELTKLYDLTPPGRNNHGHRRKHPLLPALTTTAQALNRAAASALLRFTDKFYEPADVIIQRWWDHGVSVTSVAPSMFTEVAHHSESTIRTGARRPVEGRFLREVRRPVWQLRRLAAALAAARGQRAT